MEDTPYYHDDKKNPQDIYLDSEKGQLHILTRLTAAVTSF